MKALTKMKMRKEINIKETINQMTLKEKAMFLTGSCPVHNYGVERLGISELTMLDGPNGLRKVVEDGDSLGGISKSEKTTCFPCGAMLASTWDKQLIRKVGEAIGKECAFYNVDLLLGPAVNIKRNPLCGRNFEYYSEDPFLAGKIGASFVNGVESQNVGVCVKHFAANNNEKFRFIGNSLIDERALREIYLKPYQIILEDSKPSSFMAAYNKINNEYCSQNEFLFKFLREENNFGGFVITDWGGIVDREKALNAGLDLEMPGETPHNINCIIDGVKSGRIKQETLNQSVERLLRFYNRTSIKEETKSDIFDENYNLALEVATKGAVLLKNDGILPLKNDKKYLVVGNLFSSPRYQGNGSSLLNPYKLKSHFDSFKDENIDFDFVCGYQQFDENDQSEFNTIINRIRNNEYEAILFYGGQSDLIESEGYDRTTMSLPSNQLKLLSLITKEKCKVVFVLFGGSVVEMPFANDVNAILFMQLAGEGIGEATTKLLFGEISPSGRLTQTFMKSYEGVPFGDEFEKEHDALYKESIFVGYRYYDSISKEVNYPFGYGLSYTKFEYEDLIVNEKNNEIEVRVKVKNIGHMDGEEAIQVYVAKEDSSIFRPVRELKAFDKIFLKQGEEKETQLFINKKDLQIFDQRTHKRVLEDGKYIISINKNSRDVLLSKSLNLNGEIIKEFDRKLWKNYFNLNTLNNIDNESFTLQNSIILRKNDIFSKPYTMETPLFALGGLVGHIFLKAVNGVGAKKIKKAKKMKPGQEKERELKAGTFVYNLMPVNTLRSLSFSSSGSLPYNVAKGILYITNHHYIKGVKSIIKKEEIKDE